MGCGGSKQALVKDTHQQVNRFESTLGFNPWEVVLDFLDFKDLLRVAPTCRIIHKTTGKPEILRKFQVNPSFTKAPPKRLDTLTEDLGNKPAGHWFNVDSLGASMEFTPKFQSPTGLRTSAEGFRFSTDQLRLSADNFQFQPDGVMDSLEKMQPAGLARLVLSEISETAELPGSPLKDHAGGVYESAKFPRIEESVSMKIRNRDKITNFDTFMQEIWESVCENRIKDLIFLLNSVEKDSSWFQTRSINRVFGEDTVSLLAVAVSSGSTEAVHVLLQSFPQLDVEEGYVQKARNRGFVIIRKLRPLQFACSLGVYPIVELLLEHNSHPDMSGITKSAENDTHLNFDLGAPPLYISINPRFYNSRLNIPGLKYTVRGSPAETDYLLCVQSLLKHGAKVDIPTNDPVLPTPLFASVDRPELVRLLMQHGANPNITNEKGQTPLYIVCEKTDEVESLKTLLENGGAVDPETCRPLFIALSHKRLGLVKVLRAYGAQVNGTSDNPSALQVAVSANDAGICRLILGWSELEIDWLYRQNGKNMFHRIAQNKGNEIFDLLVAHRSKQELATISAALNQSTAKDPDEGDTLPVLFAFPDVKLVRKMVDYGSNVHRLTLLKCMKAYRGDKPVVQTLLDLGVDPNTPWEGEVPLWWAHCEGKTDLISLLGKAGCRLEVPNSSGRTVLLDACFRGNLAEIRTLLRFGADLKATAEGKAAEDFAVCDYPGKSEDAKAQIVDLIRNWKPS